MFFWLIWLIDASVALHDVVRFEKAYQDIYPPELELKHENFYLLKSLLYTQKSKKKRKPSYYMIPKIARIYRARSKFRSCCNKIIFRIAKQGGKHLAKSR